jgi:hypothetical protein
VGDELVQVTPLVTLLVVPSLFVPVAVICCVVPICKEGVAGVTVMLVRVGFTKKPRHPAKLTLNSTAAEADSNHFPLNFNIPTSQKGVRGRPASRVSAIVADRISLPDTQ